MHSFVSKIVIALALAGSLVLAGCSGDDTGSPTGGAGSGGAGGAGGGGGSAPIDGAVIDTGKVGCVDTPPTACPTPPVTWSKVEPIFAARCGSLCHNGTTPNPNIPGDTLWGLKDYDHVKDWYDTIRDTINACQMPPPDAGVPMTVEERMAILEFIRCGLPQ